MQALVRAGDALRLHDGERLADPAVQVVRVGLDGLALGVAARGLLRGAVLRGLRLLLRLGGLGLLRGLDLRLGGLRLLGGTGLLVGDAGVQLLGLRVAAGQAAVRGRLGGGDALRGGAGTARRGDRDAADEDGGRDAAYARELELLGAAQVAAAQCGRNGARDLGLGGADLLAELAGGNALLDRAELAGDLTTTVVDSLLGVADASGDVRHGRCDLFV
ncbi:hypothetical protein STTU_5553 [Streptomyces sp. Tu6071]|nr:hypothetical protein STTU_5553 [Streptomyces sp. Tu6071]